MDPLCRLGFVTSELLLDGEAERFTPREDRAVVLFTRSGSFASDSRYQQTIADPADYYPSPAVFVYTLANIVTGEIAIRNRYLGETSCYLLDGDPVPQMVATVGRGVPRSGKRGRCSAAGSSTPAAGRRRPHSSWSAARRCPEELHGRKSR